MARYRTPGELRAKIEELKETISDKELNIQMLKDYKRLRVPLLEKEWTTTREEIGRLEKEIGQHDVRPVAPAARHAAADGRG